MDTVTIKTKFGKQTLSKIVSKIASDKLDCKIQINVDDVSLAHGDDGTIRFELKINGAADESIINKFT